MNCRIQKYLFLLAISASTNLLAVSIVYNFRIAQITKQPILDTQDYRKDTIIALLFSQFNKTRIDTTQNFTGGLGAFIYDFPPYYFRTDFAVSHITAKDHGDLTFSGTQTDDILFTFGRNFIFGERNVLTLSGLFGIPTHQIFRLQHAEFGIAQVGTGIQLDGSYPVAQTGAFLYGLRYIRFFQRNAYDETHRQYLFNVGNVEDLLVSYKHSWSPHGLEVGYTSRFQFGASICPNLDDTIEKTNYIRSNFYAVYKYKFLIRDLPNRFLFNASYGFDHRPHEFGNKYIITLWASWNIHF